MKDVKEGKEKKKFLKMLNAKYINDYAYVINQILKLLSSITSEELLFEARN